tara:strand:+ start:812 stop:1453 length:642 start_codon:yes stop_codon:yes gene_type:complete
MLTYSKDINKEDILLDSNQEQVMMEWEKHYMEECINTLNPKGNVLEIGFGMGYSATQIQKHNPKSHTIIECDPTVIKKCKQWAKKYNNIIIIEAKWQEVICTNTLNKYDEIFFDDFPNNVKIKSKIENFQINHRFHIFVDFLVQYHLKQGSKISAYICDKDSLFNNSYWKSKYINNPKWDYNEKIIKTKVSNIQKYHQSNNKAIIPLLTFNKI